MRIAIFGTFDVENYGDLLFPLLAQKRLRTALGATVEAVSPVGSAPVWSDCLPSIAYDFAETSYDGVLIGGGNIIRISPTDLAHYDRGLTSMLAYSNLWLGASCEISNGAPICWNAPGVPDPFPGFQHELVRSALDQARYVAVRDEQSRKFLLEASPNSDIALVPDPAWEIDGLWAAELLDAEYQSSLSGNDRGEPTRTVAIHLNARYTKGATDRDLSLELDSIARELDARPILLALGPCHGDDALARRIGGLMESQPIVIDKPQSLLQVAACISRSVAYVGSSMHGFITACAFGVPALCVVNFNVVKFQGIEDLLGRPSTHVDDWRQVADYVRGGGLHRVRDAVATARSNIVRGLDQHWRRVVEEFSVGRSSSTPAKSERLDSLVLASLAKQQHRRAGEERTKRLLLETHFTGLKGQLTELGNRFTALQRSEAELATREAQHAKHIAELKAQVRAQSRELEALKQSRSWAITKPLRAVSMLYARQRRGLATVAAQTKEDTAPASKTVHPTKERRRRLNVAMIAAEAALMDGNWTDAITLWRKVLEQCDDNQGIGSKARTNISIAERISSLEDYKSKIASYASGQRDKNIKIAVYSAIAQSYDTVKMPALLDSRFDYFLFADQPQPSAGVFNVRPIDFSHEDPTRSARFVKTHPHWLLEDYEVAVWIDSNIMILGDIYPLIEKFIASGEAVAAVPHPLRTSISDELNACIERRKEDGDLMKMQVDTYLNSGFATEDLIESNLMMFKLRDSRLPKFLNTWWSEIDKHSKRDQLSLNYALLKHQLDFHRLTERPMSVRDHPLFGIVLHDSGTGAAGKLIEALEASPVDPYAGPSYASVRDERIARQADRKIDIVVCVHNALEDVRLCLESVSRTHRSQNQRLIVIDDGSQPPTVQYLREFASGKPWVELHRSEQGSGYTKAANRGVSASTAEFVILLNSDTIVTDGWAEKMADAVFSTPGAGVVGPMSNAASHQSIPEHLSSGGQTAVNDLPPGMTPDDMNRFCEEWTVATVLPRVGLVHGFCFGVTRQVLETVGLFDEEHFPRGYGEENDFCFRATDAGFGLVIATHTFVYHAKSKSYLGSERLALMKEASDTLKRLHGVARIRRAITSMQSNPTFVELRRRALELYLTKTSSPTDP